jgi:hypothetical protein
MKKLFIVLAVASLGFVACNNEASTEDAAKKIADSTRVADSLAKVAADAEAAAKAAMDTANKAVDTLKK